MAYRISKEKHRQSEIMRYFRSPSSFRGLRVSRVLEESTSRWMLENRLHDNGIQLNFLQCQSGKTLRHLNDVSLDRVITLICMFLSCSNTVFYVNWGGVY